MAAIETALAVTLLPHFITDPSWVSGLMPPVVGENGDDDGGDRNGTCSDFASPLHNRSLLGSTRRTSPLLASPRISRHRNCFLETPHIFDGEREGTATDVDVVADVSCPGSLKGDRDWKGEKRNPCREDRLQPAQVTLTRCQVDDLPDCFRTL